MERSQQGILAIVALVAIVGLMSGFSGFTAQEGGDLTGQATLKWGGDEESNSPTYEESNSPTYEEPFCTDSDGGENYYEKGVTSFAKFMASSAPQEWTDLCYRDYYKYQIGEYSNGGLTEENGLLEGRCGPNTDEPGVIFGFECPNGCEGGACLGPFNVFDGISSNKYCDENGEDCFDKSPEGTFPGDLWTLNGVLASEGILAVAYCDEHGENCFSADDVGNSGNGCVLLNFFDQDLDDICADYNKECTATYVKLTTYYYDSIDSNCGGSVQYIDEYMQTYFCDTVISEIIGNECNSIDKPNYIEPISGDLKTYILAIEKVLCC